MVESAQKRSRGILPNEVRWLAREFGEFAKRKLLGRGKAEFTLSEKWYFAKIGRTIPEVASYKTTTIRHVKTIGVERDCESLKLYYDKLCSDKGERDYLRVNLTKKGTHFFRGNDWGFFNANCLSTFQGTHGLTIWCAGCSSGEETYSVIMSLLDYVALDDIEVLATDYNDELLEKCLRGEYSPDCLAEIPEAYHRYLETSQNGFSIKRDLRDVVRIANINLLTDEYPRGFDVIICRNVIKFFSTEARAQVKRRLVASLNKGGYLFVSADDNHMGLELIGNTEAMGVTQVGGRSIYKKL